MRFLLPIPFFFQPYLQIFTFLEILEKKQKLTHVVVSPKLKWKGNQRKTRFLECCCLIYTCVLCNDDMSSTHIL